MKSATWKSTLALLALAALAGCAQPPTEEIAKADEAMDAARAAEAPDYAPTEWAAVEDHREQLDSELDSQRQASALSRSYEHARSLAAETTELADQAAAEALGGKARAQEDAAMAIEQAKKLEQEVARLLENAPQGKGTKVDLAAMRSDAGSSEASLQEAQRSYEAGSYLDAHVKADEVVRRLQGIKDEIERAREVRGGRA